MPFVPKPTGPAVFSLLAACVSPLSAADATTPVDYTQRNSPFAPTASVSAEKKTPEANSSVQEKRFETTAIEKQTSPIGERRAAIDMKESREKNVRPKDSRRPERIDQPVSSYNGRQAAISTAADTTKPPAVAKYQDSLTAASASNMARFPALDGATGAKINRFVFRKNPEEQKAITSGAAVTPAAGGAVLSK